MRLGSHRPASLSLHRESSLDRYSGLAGSREADEAQESPYVSLTASLARVSLAGRTLLPQEGSDAGPGGEALGNPPPGF